MTFSSLVSVHFEYSGTACGKHYPCEYRTFPLPRLAVLDGTAHVPGGFRRVIGSDKEK